MDSSILSHYHMDLSRLISLFVCNIPLQHIETQLSSTVIHFNCTIMYRGTRIVNPGKTIISARVQLCQFFFFISLTDSTHFQLFKSVLFVPVLFCKFVSELIARLFRHIWHSILKFFYFLNYV